MYYKRTITALMWGEKRNEFISQYMHEYGFIFNFYLLYTQTLNKECFSVSTFFSL